MTRLKKTTFAVLGIATASGIAAVLLGHIMATGKVANATNKEATVVKPTAEKEYVSLQTRANAENAPIIPILLDDEVNNHVRTRPKGRVVIHPQGRVFTTPKGRAGRYQITIPKGWIVVRQEVADVSWWENGWCLLLRSKSNTHTTLQVDIDEHPTFSVDPWQKT